MKNNLFILLFCFIGMFFSMKAYSQELSVSGTVTDQGDEPLPGVNIVVKGTTTGTTTNDEGYYSLDVPESDATLVFNFMGFKSREINVDGQSQINVEMAEEELNLDEVVVVGYGSQKKADLTGSVSAIGGDKLSKASVPNLSASLGGKITGVITTQTSGQPGYDGTNFQIRGISTTGNNSPLIIVDGVERSFSRVDPKEVENVTVLKDAASTAVYGARAANGVVLITTKRGSSGKASFNYSGKYGIQSQTRKIDIMNTAQYTKYINEAKINDGKDPLFTDEYVEKAQRGEIPSYNWLDATLGNSAPMQKHNLSASGGTDNIKYYVNYGYLDQDGFYSKAKYNQNNLRSNLDITLKDNLKMKIDLAGRIEDRNSSPSSDQEIYAGTLSAEPNLPPTLSEEVEPGALGYNGLSGNTIGFAERSGYRKELKYVFQSNITLKYQVPGIKGLSAEGSYAYDFTSQKRKTFEHPYTYYIYNETSDEYNAAQGGVSSTRLDEERWFFNDKTLQLSLNYSKSINNHNLSALALFEQIETQSNYLNAFRDDFITEAIDELFAGGEDRWSNTGSSSETARRGYIGRIDYDYLGKYLLQANMRIDQSFNFPEDDRTGFFPAFSAGWRISEESFMKSLPAISNMKLRASWGQVGNDRVPQFQFLSNYQFGGGVVIGNNWRKGIYTTGIANPNITWETATTTNIGFDLGVFNNKLTFEFDYFSKRTEDILQPNTGVVPETFGASLPDKNIGIVDSWGSEGTIGLNNRFGDLQVNIDANYSWFDNEAIFVSEPEDILPSIAQTGRPLNQRYGYLSSGLFQSENEIDDAPIQFSESIHSSLQPGDIRYRDINGRDENGNLTGKPDGKIDADDRTLIGSSGDPNLMFGLNINMAYKGFDLMTNFQGATDFSRFLRPVPFSREGNSIVDIIDSWRPGNENAKYPRLSSDDLPPNRSVDSDFWVTEITYLRLKNIEFGYNFNILKKQFDQVGIKNLRMFFSGTNLLTFSNLDWRDPEAQGGINYPPIKTVSFGINVNF